MPVDAQNPGYFGGNVILDFEKDGRKLVEFDLSRFADCRRAGAEQNVAFKHETVAHNLDVRAIAQRRAQRFKETRAHFLQFLIDQRRLVHFEAIHEEFERLANEASGLVTAHVRAASELDERKQDRLRRALSQRTGREVRLDIRVDPSLVGGAIATVGDMVFDGSVRTQLGRLRSTLTKGS